MESVEIQWENSNICTFFDEGPLFEGKNRQELINFHRIRVRKSNFWDDFTSNYVVFDIFFKSFILKLN